MKIIHCADLHLDSALNTHLQPVQAGQRRHEMLLQFQKLITFAQKHGVRVIMIAGDLFDTSVIGGKTRNIILSYFREHPDIDFLYLPGNHDEGDVFRTEILPANLKIFQDDNTIFRYGSIVITGLVHNDRTSELDLSKDDRNLVMMHGQVVERKPGSDQPKPVEINLNELRGKNIDYLALGHIHSYREERLDTRGIYCYSGCLEPRGFDEIGEKGFVYLNIEDRIEHTFVPYASRTAYECRVDVTGMMTTPQVCSVIEHTLGQPERKDLVRIVLTGELEMEADIDLNYIQMRYEQYFFACSIEDQTRMKRENVMSWEDHSLKGTYVQMVLESAEDEDMKRDMIRYGLRALSGEEI